VVTTTTTPHLPPQVVDAMQVANAALGALHKALPVDRVAELLDDVEEAVAYQVGAR
jgi:hypothetical protein